MNGPKFSWRLETVRPSRGWTDERFILDDESESLFEMTNELRKRLLNGTKRLSLVMKIEGWTYFAEVENDGKSLILPERFWGYGKTSDIRVPQGFRDLLDNALVAINDRARE